MSDRKAFLLRLPPELHNELRAWAAQEMRSLNAQIEFLLRDALRRRRGRAEDRDAGHMRDAASEDPDAGLDE